MVGMEADELRDLLLLSGHSQEWLARQLRVKPNTVWRYANGRATIPGSRDDDIRGLLSTTCPACGHQLVRST